MSFQWPHLLWLLLLLPLLVLTYVWLLRRRRKTTVRMARRWAKALAGDATCRRR